MPPEIATLKAEIEKLNISFFLHRKIHGILNAFIMQVEDNNGDVEVMRLLLEALRVSLREYVGSHQAEAALQAINACEKAGLENLKFDDW